MRRTRVTCRFGHLADYICARVCLSVWSLLPQGYAGQGGGENVVRPRPGAALFHLPGTYRRLRSEFLHAALGVCFLSFFLLSGGTVVSFFFMHAVLVIVFVARLHYTILWRCVSLARGICFCHALSATLVCILFCFVFCRCPRRRASNRSARREGVSTRDHHHRCRHRHHSPCRFPNVRSVYSRSRKSSTEAPPHGKRTHVGVNVRVGLSFFPPWFTHTRDDPDARSAEGAACKAATLAALASAAGTNISKVQNIIS